MQPNKPISDTTTPTPSVDVVERPSLGAVSPHRLSEKKSKKVLLIFISIVLIAIAGMGTVFGLQVFMPGKKVVDVTGVDAAHVETSTTRCGTTTITDNNFSESPYTGCFDLHFSACTPATITVDNQSSFLRDTIVSYQILNKQDVSCLVQWRYDTLPANTAWEGQTVTCPYDNTKDFYVAFNAKSNFTNCIGPLLDLMSS